MFKFWKRKPADAAPAAVPAAEAVPLADLPAAGAALETGTAVPVVIDAVVPEAPSDVAVETARLRDKASWRERLGGSAFSRALSSVFDRNPRLDDELLDELETALLAADVGIAATTAL